ncbi:MAG: hypothetical protein ACRDHZ_04125 [Ktedonobacteraceae bacterium]
MQGQEYCPCIPTIYPDGLFACVKPTKIVLFGQYDKLVPNKKDRMQRNLHQDNGVHPHLSERTNEPSAREKQKAFCLG